jgi:hypothetical protein
MLEFDANDDHARLPGAGEGDAYKAGAPRPPIVRCARDLDGPHRADEDGRRRQQRPPAQLARLRAAARGGCTRTARPAVLVLARARRLRRRACHGRSAGSPS